jgi:hypothetical protein
VLILIGLWRFLPFSCFVISQISRKFYSFRFRKPPEQQTDLTKIENPHGILSLKQQAQKQRKNIEGCKREKANNL